MSEQLRKWCPSSWLDEVVPARVADPSDALHQFSDGRWAVVCENFRDAKATDPSTDFMIQFLEPGQVVGWCYTEGRGDFVLTIARDDECTWSLDGPMPEQVSHWLSTDDWETMADTVPELIRYGEFEPGEHNVMAYYWSGEFSFRFELTDGHGRFIQIAGPN